MEVPDDTLGQLYLWDGLEKKGFPVTDDVMIVDIDGLTWDQKQIIAMGNEMEIDELVKEEGMQLNSFVMMGATVFVKLMSAVYQNESEEKRREIGALIKDTMKDIIDGWSDADE